MNWLRSSLVLVLMIAVFCGSASALTLLLNGPSDGVTVTDSKVEFIYGFDNIPDIENCSLFVDGKYQTSRGMLFNMGNNRITHTLDAGEHSWRIECVTKEGKDLLSETRAITVDLGLDASEGFTIIYNNNRLRSYVVPIVEGKGPIELPAIISGEDIQLKTAQKTYYVDILKMGVMNENPFVELRDRSAGRIQKILAGEGLSFDFEEDGVIDATVALDRVERNVKAYFTVEAFPGGTGAEEIPEAAEEVEEPIETTEETPVEAAPEEEEEAEVAQTAPEETESTPTKEASPALKYGLLILLAVIIIAAIAAVLLNKGGGIKVKKEGSDWIEIKPAKAKHSHKPRSEPAALITSGSKKRRK